MEKRYRLLTEGQGGTFDFPHPIWTTAPTPLGTKFCLTCVGVYFQIDAKRAFLAHMLPPSPRSHSTPPPSHATTALLAHEAAAHAWGPPSDLMRTTLVLVCPFPTLWAYVRARQRAGCAEQGMSDAVLAAVLARCAEEGEGEGREVMEGVVGWMFGDGEVDGEGGGQGERDGDEAGEGKEEGGARGGERWRRFWIEGAHGFVVRDVGALPEFWHVKEESLKRGLSAENTAEEDGWVGEEVAACDGGDWRVFA
ncbi:hypothetical protein W97_03259 [Coniosporium apollinis CBS 100218]|uniref:Uncharacterized protein n=1 Tax=Coniosporium apollinis (strain CBS 100218) TaxID=1168221 RepID=R7YQC9_CONA1|nr:uncharacterized protein W97_03259 [Coniosporium apollinis CBS 100218]EON64029.1 hypothetical protein W97_03259 [Coniosporium apollinis CBS 100218]